MGEIFTQVISDLGYPGTMYSGYMPSLFAHMQKRNGSNPLTVADMEGIMSTYWRSPRGSPRDKSPRPSDKSPRPSAKSPRASAPDASPRASPRRSKDAKNTV